MLRLGPILQFLGEQGGIWGVSVLVVTDVGVPAPMLAFPAGATAQPMVANPVPGLPMTAWRVDVAFPQESCHGAQSYRVEGVAHTVHIPAPGLAPAMGYVSCNGFSDPRARKQLQEPQALWRRLQRLHDEIDRVDNTRFGPLHLLLMGGDQIYSDDMRAAVPALRAW